jgi:hypothetical protein
MPNNSDDPVLQNADMIQRRALSAATQRSSPC